MYVFLNIHLSIFVYTFNTTNIHKYLKGELKRNTKPYTKKGNRVYEYFNSDNVRFRVIIGDKKNGERVISFFSNRKAGRGNDSHDYIYNQPLQIGIVSQNKPEVNNNLETALKSIKEALEANTLEAMIKTEKGVA